MGYFGIKVGRKKTVLGSLQNFHFLCFPLTRVFNINQSKDLFWHFGLWAIIGMGSDQKTVLVSQYSG